ncbi:MAG: hypothetical protein QG661_2299, partial [Actinomycetota bacterium]|nr:hypothetical protein [Actinomycetota bacterium]
RSGASAWPSSNWAWGEAVGTNASGSTGMSIVKSGARSGVSDDVEGPRSPPKPPT